MRLSPSAFPGALLRLSLLLPGIILAGSCSDPAKQPDSSSYTSGETTPGGTGRYYMGREIATVMSHTDAGKLDRPEREQKERTDLLIDLLPIRGAMAIADIGAGSGYFTLRLARQFPTATLLAVDIQPEMLAIIDARAEAEALGNIELILGDEQSAGLPAGSTDLILLVDSYHEFRWPQESMRNLRAALKPGGTIVIVEQRSEDTDNPLVPAHKMFADQIVKEMKAAELYPAGSSDQLPEQHFLLFSHGPAENDSG